ncbi:MAG: TraM recognition domain-containing protein, partial [Campylobacterota bacterium]|nr:TraM recognition domain-containing protein [Campylobacterota bacterium]
MKVGLVKDTKLKEETPLVDVKFTHSLCIGQTGSGKTTSFIYPNLQHRMEIGHGVLFFDIKGSEHLAIKKLAYDAGRLDGVIEIGKPWGSNINIIESLNNRTFATLLQDLVGDPASGGSNTYFYNEAISLGNSIFEVLKLKSIILKEMQEIDNNSSFGNESFFTLHDMYSIIYSIDTLYGFIQDIKKFAKQLHTFIIKNTDHYYGEHSEVYKNIILNYSNINVATKFFIKYDVKADERGNSDKFESSLLYVISTLSSGFGFMVTSSAKYISDKESPLDIVNSLQDGKIVIINVRVIPDTILELMLEQIFEQMIDLNLQSEEDKKPISVFIDEAQRLINKDIPLDVLRSSKVDVLMAVQSELQLVSKFGSREDWQQISVNIAQKFAFKSAYFGGDHLLSFYVDTATLDTFEYAKEHDSNKLRANPVFLNKEDFNSVEHTYLHDILKLKDLKKNEILFYDVTHFENEREVVLLNTQTKKKRYQKIFTEFQDKII